MTSPAPARVIPPPTPEQLAERKAKRERLAALVTAAPKILRESRVELVAYYDVTPPMTMPDQSVPRVLTRIRVSVIRHPDRPAEVSVRGEVRRRNANGQPRANGETWRALPKSLAAELLGRALTTP